MASRFGATFPRSSAVCNAVLAAWLAHAYTASGVVLAFLATRAVVEHRYREAFLWLALQIFVDSTDGVLARRARVATLLPWFNGSKLDDIVDYLTYVFVPALLVWRALLVPDAWALPVACAMLLASAFGFNREDAKTSDHFFTGFPSYWNIVVLYLFVARLTPVVNAVILLSLAVLVFVPIRYVYPSRTPTLQGADRGTRRDMGGPDAGDALAASGRVAAGVLGVAGVSRLLRRVVDGSAFQRHAGRLKPAPTTWRMRTHDVGSRWGPASAGPSSTARRWPAEAFDDTRSTAKVGILLKNLTPL